MEFLKGKKTYIVAVLLAAVSLVEFLTGGMTLTEFLSSDNLKTLLESAGLATLRAGVASR